MYSFTSNLSKVKRVFEGFDYSVVQGCVNGLRNDETSQNGPSFVYTVLKNTVENYFSLNLAPKYKRNQYECEVILTDPYTDMGTSKCYKGTTITFRIIYYPGFEYANQKKFIIKERV